MEEWKRIALTGEVIYLIIVDPLYRNNIRLSKLISIYSQDKSVIA